MFNNSIENIYIINGLSKCGNNLFASWLISSFDDNEVYFLDNVKPDKYNLYSNEVDLNLLGNSIVANDNDTGKIEDNLRKKLVKENDMKTFLNGGSDIKTLVITMENKEAEEIDNLSELFTNAKNLYKCIVIRDILNMVSSKIESDNITATKAKSKKTTQLMDKMTEYWLNNYYNSQKKEYITFNYNKFLCYNVSRKTLAKKLNINFDKANEQLNLIGCTNGDTSVITNKSDYYMKWLKHRNNKFINELIYDDKIIKILCREFLMCLNANVFGFVKGQVKTYEMFHLHHSGTMIGKLDTPQATLSKGAQFSGLAYIASSSEDNQV